jgi:hypothetical protein
MNPELQGKPAVSAAGDPTSAQAWNELEPHVDEAITALAPSDRTVIALRFFEQKSLAQIASDVGITEEAARKRVARALEKGAKISRAPRHRCAGAGGDGVGTDDRRRDGGGCAGIARGGPPRRTALSASAATGSVATTSLAGGAMKMMALAKLKAAAIVLLAWTLPISVAAVAAVPASSRCHGDANRDHETRDVLHLPRPPARWPGQSRRRRANQLPTRPFKTCSRCQPPPATPTATSPSSTSSTPSC